MIDHKQWDVIRKQAKETSVVPEWATAIYEKPLPELERQTEVRVESKCINQSYIDFLQEQIEVDARGVEWTNLLKRRQEALKPFVGKTLSFLSITDANRVLWVRFDPENNQVVLVEAHGR